MVDFNKLKNARSNSLNKLNEELSKFSNNNSNSSKDDRYWNPTVDDQQNGYAVIRFLPAPGEEDVPFVRLWDHGFQGPGGWYIENSLTTLGQDDPVSKYNSELWNSGLDANKDVARKQKRRLHYIANIYVVKDTGKPENEGKVFLYKFGKKIFEKIKDAMNPTYEDEEPINPFDFWDGANFKLKIRNVEGYRNYDKSEFDKPSPLFNDDSKLEEVWKSEYSLSEIVDPKNFKSYDELQKRLNKVLGLNEEIAARTPSTPAKENGRIKEETLNIPDSNPWDGPSEINENVDDDDLAFFKKLAKED